MINKIEKTDEKVVFETDMETSLANALRRSVSEVPTIAIDEVDLYKNDSALYDEVIAHRLGFVPLKNQKLVSGKPINLKLKGEGNEGGSVVLAKDLGKEVVYPDMPIVFLEKDQELELVARAVQGIGKDHSKHSPGLAYYKQGSNIVIDKEGEKQEGLAKVFPEVFVFEGKLKVKNAWASDLDEGDMKNFKGIKIEPKEGIVFFIESWGMMGAKDIFLESAKALKDNLNELSKALK